MLLLINNSCSWSFLYSKNKGILPKCGSAKDSNFDILSDSFNFHLFIKRERERKEILSSNMSNKY